MSPEQAVYVINTTTSQIPLIDGQQEQVEIAIANLTQRVNGNPISLTECKKSLALLNTVMQGFPKVRDVYKVTRTAVAVLTAFLDSPTSQETTDEPSVCS